MSMTGRSCAGRHAPRRRADAGQLDARRNRARSADPRASMAISASRCRGSTAPLKVRGEARFAAEFAIEGMVYAALVLQHDRQGRIAALDTAAGRGGARRRRGDDPPQRAAARSRRQCVRRRRRRRAATCRSCRTSRIHWNGEPVAVVLAETQEQADHAASLVSVTYDAEAAVTDFAAARVERAHDPGNVLGEPLRDRDRRCRGGAGRGPSRVDATYTTPRHNHNAIELHAVTVAWPDGQLLVHDASQLVASTGGSLAQVFGLKPRRCASSRPSSAAASAASACGAPGPGRRGGEAGRPAGAARADARGRLSPGRRPHDRRSSASRWARHATAGSTP